MDAGTATTYQTPFPTHSVNILVATTSAGKSTLVLKIILHQNIYLNRPVQKIIVVLCNPIIDNSSLYTEGVDEKLQDLIQVTSLDDLDLEQDLEPGTFLIFEDVQFLTPKILQAVNFHAHHSNLESVFIIVQGLLGRRELFPILSLAHRVILFFSSASSTRLAKFISSQFFNGPEIKDYLNKIISEAEKNKSILLLELNQINGEYKPKFLAISGLDHLADTKPAIVYPHMNEMENYDREFVDEAEVDHPSYPPGSFVLIPAANVRRKAIKKKEDSEDSDDKRVEWERMSEIVERNINSSVPIKKRGPAKNVAISMLECNKFAVSNDGKTITIKGDPKSKIPMLDFILTAIRQSGPNEQVDPTFKKYMNILMDNHTPRSFFKNKNLMMNIKKRKTVKPVSFAASVNRRHGRKKFSETLDS